MNTANIPHTALVVDDDPLLVDLTRRVLTAFGVTTIEAADSGATALERMRNREHDFDIVLCDLAMPSMDGIDFLHHLAELRYPGAVVIVSGQDDRVIQGVARIAMGNRLNVLGCLQKPFAIGELRELIQQIDPAGEPPAPAETRQERSIDFSPTELATAIFAGDLSVQYQPKINLATGSVRGVEALARWNLGGRGPISPAQFIPVAEQYDLARPLTELILGKALAQSRRWLNEGICLQVAVNMPAFALTDPSLPLSVLNAARDAGVNPTMLTIEVTETQLLREPVTSLETLNRLRLQGVRLSIDDFGTSYSSPKQLQLIPFQELKIDRDFVQRAVADSVSLAIVESSIQLARNTSLKVVAEGVETAEQLDLMRQLECDEAQGFFIARPMDGDAVSGWLDANRSRLRPASATGSRPSPGNAALTSTSA